MRRAVVAATIVARNYLPFARVLSESYLQQHPAHRFAVLVTDDVERKHEAGEGFEVFRLEDLRMPHRELERMISMYDVMELATAVKPWLLRSLLEDGADLVVYLDPDISVYAPFEGLEELALAHGAVLTPHRIYPVDDPNVTPTELEILGRGTFNLGFAAVSADAIPMLTWWGDRLRRHAIVDPATMHFTDQRWVDLVPGYFEPFVLRDPGWNVAYWNLHERPLTQDGDRLLAAGERLRFFHFSGFRLGDSPDLSSHQRGNPHRHKIADDPVLSSMSAAYAERLVAAGSDDPAEAYGLATTATGRRLDKWARRAYRTGLIDAEAGGDGDEPPCPAIPEESALFDQWLAADVTAAPGLNRYMKELYEDLGLGQGPQFPGDTRRFLRWARANAETLQIQVDLLPSIPQAPWARGLDVARIILPEFPRLWRLGRWIRGATSRVRRIPTKLRHARHQASQSRRFSAPRKELGVNVAGFLRAEIGVGEAARAMISVLRTAGVPFSTVNYSQTLNRQMAHVDLRDNGAPYDLNLVTVNWDMMRHFAIEVGPRFFDGRYTIAYWHLELDAAPAELPEAARYADEVWCSSKFGADAIAEVSERPVRVFPLPIMPPRIAALSREALGLPADRKVFLFFFDFFSVMERKNPLALIEAYTTAFSETDGAFLLIKTINGNHRPRQLATLRAATRSRRDIRIRDEYLDGDVRSALMAQCDAYVSLHRSEGFGLTLAEAMALGRPVIATGYSGNLEFMTPENSFLVPYSMTTVPRGCAPYPAGGRWASPDIGEAATIMRGILDEPAEAERRAALGQTEITRDHSPAARSVLLTRYLDEARAAAERPGGRRVAHDAASLVLQAQRDVWGS